MLVQTTPPAIEPVTVQDVYLNSRINDTSEEALILLLISAARRYAETYTARSFITQSWRLTLDSFSPMQNPGLIHLERGNVLSVDGISYTAMDGTDQTADPTQYIADLSSNPARLTPRFGRIWPIPLPQIASVRIDYTAGYGASVESVPEGIRHWILMRVATLYENREEVAVLQRGKVQELPFIDGLLDPYRIETA